MNERPYSAGGQEMPGSIENEDIAADHMWDMEDASPIAGDPERLGEGGYGGGADDRLQEQAETEAQPGMQQAADEMDLEGDLEDTTTNGGNDWETHGMQSGGAAPTG